MRGAPRRGRKVSWRGGPKRICGDQRYPPAMWQTQRERWL